MRIVSSVLMLLCVADIAAAQERKPVVPDLSKPWFGVALPPAFSTEPAVIVGEREARPFVAPANEKADSDLLGSRIRKDLERIVEFSKESRAKREIGSGQLWGRVSGFASSAATIEWSASQLRAAGITDVRMQPINQEPAASFWLPQSWEVRLLGDPALGRDSRDVVLESAIAVPPSAITNGELTAPLVYVGSASPSAVANADVKGKIAVQLTVPQGHMLFEREPVTTRAQELMKRGAVAVLNLVRLPGNERSRDFSNCGGPCFNLGGRDGWFVERVLDRAVQAGVADKVRAKLTLQSKTYTGLSAQNAIGVVPGSKGDEVVLIDAHADAWFDGAGDNADGLAVMLALARHFAKAENRLQRTLVFIVSAGHHTPGINGPRNFVRSNPDLAKQAALVLNIEHVAQRNFSPARTTAADGYRHAVADSGEAPIVVGVSNRSTALNKFVAEGATRYATNLVSEPSPMQSGETGGFAEVPAAKITVMQAPPLYHTTGETLDVISTPGLERMARFLAYFLREVDKLPRDQFSEGTQATRADGGSE
ncbi:MAG TPA: M28 family peptidase [Steroidobacteraceae bacterium]|nr:M28 family peptidase [Steroidobacteraceae bacterium]